MSRPTKNENGVDAFIELEPDLQLITIQRALEDAVEREDAGRMAQNLLHQARLLMARRRQSRLTALQKMTDQNGLERAWRLAEENNLEVRNLWYLLLAWALSNDGRWAEARATLDQLSRGKLTSIDPDDLKGHNRMATWLLAQLVRKEPQVALDFIDIMATCHLGEIIESLLESQHYRIARQFALEAKGGCFRIGALAAVAVRDAILDDGGKFITDGKAKNP